MCCAHGLCGQHVIVFGVGVEVHTLLVRANNTFAVTIGAKTCHVALSHVCRSLVRYICGKLVVAFPAFFYFVECPRAALVAIVTHISSLGILSGLRGLNDDFDIITFHAHLIADTALRVCGFADRQAIW